MRSRRPPRLHVSAALALLTFAGCTYAVVSGGKINLQHAERIYTDVQEMRQLNFKAEVPLVLMDQAQANRVLEREVARRYGEVELQRAAEVGALTGLYAAGTNLKAQAMRMLSSQVVGFYDPQDREMILVKSESRPGLWSKFAGFFTRRDATGEMLVAHELTHALQEQYFGIHSALDRITDNDDAELALKAVAEGDATLVGYGYVGGRLDAETIGKLLTHFEDMPKLFDVQSPGTPTALRDSLIFQYSDGTRFVGEAYKRGGWNAVNVLYRKPPLSTRQIIDPALYFDRHSTPLATTVGGWKRTLRGWHEVAENTYGELLLSVILMRNQSGQARAAVARRWRGDRMAVLQKGGALTVIWIVALSDDTSAAAFAYDYERILSRIATGTAAPHHVERRDAAVLAIIGPGAAQSAELAPAVWRASAIVADAPGSGA
jgi:hypothetical protein